MMAAILWLFCIGGQAIHWYLKADCVKRSASPIGTIREWFGRNRAKIVARLFWCNLAFAGWVINPDFVNDVARVVAGHLQPGVVQSLIMKLGIPLNIITAGAYGYCCDSLLDKARTRWLGGANELALNGHAVNADEKSDSASAGQ